MESLEVILFSGLSIAKQYHIAITEPTVASQSFTLSKKSRNSNSEKTLPIDSRLQKPYLSARTLFEGADADHRNDYLCDDTKLSLLRTRWRFLMEDMKGAR